MKMIRWVVVLFLTASGCALSCAQVLPDGAIGVKNSLNSQPVTSLSAPLLFQNCSTATEADIIADCKSFGGAQAVFAGINETQFAWNFVAISLDGYDPQTDPNVTCNGDDFFQTCAVIKGADCTKTATSCTLTVDFFQGNQEGVGCYNLNLSPTNPINLGCLSNSETAFNNDLNPHNPTLPYNSAICNGFFFPYPRGAVCGPDDFAVGIGGSVNGQSTDFNTPLSNDAGLGADGATPAAITPEPQTFVMVAGAMLGMLFLAIKRAGVI